MIFKLNNQLNLSGMNTNTAELIKKELTIQNPAYSEAKRMNSLICPRGGSSKIYKICRRHGETIKFVDKRLKLQPVKFRFHGELRLIQMKAVKSSLSKDFGVLEASTGSGKSIMCLYMIAQKNNQH